MTAVNSAYGGRRIMSLTAVISVADGRRTPEKRLKTPVHFVLMVLAIRLNQTVLIPKKEWIVGVFSKLYFWLFSFLTRYCSCW